MLQNYTLAEGVRNISQQAFTAGTSQQVQGVREVGLRGSQREAGCNCQNLSLMESN